MEDNYETSGMSLVELFALIKKRIVMILTIVILSTVGVFLISSFLIAPKYVSSVKFYIESERASDDVSSDLSALNYTQKVADTYVELLKTNDFLTTLSEQSGNVVSAAELKNMIDVTSVNNTEIITASVESESPETSFSIASNLATMAPDEMDDIKSKASLVVVETPLQPTKPSSPNIPLNTAVGFLAGLFIAVAAAVVMDLLDTRIQTKRDIEEKLGYSVLAVVPRIQ